jgi:hypothetical protein
MEAYFKNMSFDNPIEPNAAVSGFVFTNLDEGEKVVQVDLIGPERAKFLTFFLEVPGMKADYLRVDFDSLFAEEDFVELDEDGLRAVLVLGRFPKPLTEIQSFEWERPKFVRFLDVSYTNQE